MKFTAKKKTLIGFDISPAAIGHTGCVFLRLSSFLP